MNDLKVNQVDSIQSADWVDKAGRVVSPTTGFGQDQIFHEAVTYSKAPELQENQAKPASRSLWTKATQLISRAKQQEVDLSHPVGTSNDTQAISPIPTLEEPEPLKNKELQLLLDSSEPLPLIKTTAEAVDPLSQEPVLNKEEILHAIVVVKDLMKLASTLMRRQLELDQQQAELSKEYIEEFEKQKKALDKKLDALAEQIRLEEDASRYLGYVQGVASAAAVVCTLVALIPGVNAVAVPIAGGIASVSSAIATAGKVYFDSKSTRHKQAVQQHQYKEEDYKKHTDMFMGAASKASEQTKQTHELLIKMNKHSHLLKENILTN